MNYPTIDLVATGQRIRELRKAKNLKVREISEYMGFTEPQAVYKWQRGESLPTVDNLYALSVLYETPMEDIIVIRERQEEAEIASSFILCRENVQSTFFCLYKSKDLDKSLHIIL